MSRFLLHSHTLISHKIKTVTGHNLLLHKSEIFLPDDCRTEQKRTMKGDSDHLEKKNSDFFFPQNFDI